MGQQTLQRGHETCPEQVEGERVRGEGGKGSLSKKSKVSRIEEKKFHKIVAHKLALVIITQTLCSV